MIKHIGIALMVFLGAQLVMAASKKITRQELQHSMQLGIVFLLKRQNPDGSWGSAQGTKDINIYSPVQEGHYAMRAASTAIVMHAIAQAVKQQVVDKQTIGLSTEQLASCRDCLLKGWHFLQKAYPFLKRESSSHYNVWAHIYCLQALSNLAVAVPSISRDKIIAEVKKHVTDCYHLQSLEGGWGYYNFGERVYQRIKGRSTSFTTASMLNALDTVQQKLQVVYPKKRKEQAINFLLSLKSAHNYYVYSSPHKGRYDLTVNKRTGSLSRSVVANLALWQAGKMSLTIVDNGMTDYFKKHAWLKRGVKTNTPHAATFAIAGYYYYYSVFYAAKTIPVLPKQQKVLAARELSTILWQSQEKKTGLWWDFPLYNYHYYYGTGFALFAQLICYQTLYSS